nr:hypothetical protein [Sporomusa acidovorans]
MLVSLPDFKVVVPLALITLSVWVFLSSFSLLLLAPTPPLNPPKEPVPKPKDAPSDADEELFLVLICETFLAAARVMKKIMSQRTVP